MSQSRWCMPILLLCATVPPFATMIADSMIDEISSDFGSQPDQFAIDDYIDQHRHNGLGDAAGSLVYGQVPCKECIVPACRASWPLSLLLFLHIEKAG